MAKFPRNSPQSFSRQGVLDWLRSPVMDASFLSEDMRFTLLLLDQYEPGIERILAERAELGELSWLGGPALGPVNEWPRNESGEALAHIATIQLSEAQALLESPDFIEPEWPETAARLPAAGYLEVFHHLGTFGNPEDDQTGGWLVRHVTHEGEGFPPLVNAPADLELPHEVCQPVLLGTGFSVPRSVDFVDHGDDAFEAAARVETELNGTWLAWRQGVESVPEPVTPTSHLYGHSDSGTEYAHAILSEVRPLSVAGDSYVLLLSVESWDHLNGWFGDAGNFEVWMRSSDLMLGRFDQAWCMIRTD